MALRILKATAQGGWQALHVNPGVYGSSTEERMPVLVLVRHSLPEIDPAVSSREWRLSEEGRVRSRILAENLVKYDLDQL